MYVPLGRYEKSHENNRTSRHDQSGSQICDYRDDGLLTIMVTGIRKGVKVDKDNKIPKSLEGIRVRRVRVGGPGKKKKSRTNERKNDNLDGMNMCRLTRPGLAEVSAPLVLR